VKYLLPLIGGIATVAWLTSHSSAKIPAPHKYAAAVVIILACIIAGTLIDRAFRPKPKAAPQRPGYPFGGPQRPRR
jgi:hypothetical protein